MKKTTFYFVLISIGTVLFVTYYFYPREIFIHTSGIKYRLGDDGQEESIHVFVKGKMYKSLSGNKTFRGAIELEGEEVPVSPTKEQLKLPFYKEYNALIYYPYVEDRMPLYYIVGTIYLDQDYKKVTIALMEKQDNKQGSWNSANGLMVSAPASNRSEAINISNELMKQHLDGFKLE